MAIHIIAIHRLVATLVSLHHSPVQAYSGKNALGTRIRQNLRVHFNVGAGSSAPAYGAGCYGSIRSELEFVAEQALQRMIIHEKHDDVRGRAADLIPHASAINGHKQRRTPTMPSAASCQSAAVAAAEYEGKLHVSWDDGDTFCRIQQVLGNALIRRLHDPVENAGVKLMIAYRLHLERGNLEAIEIVKSGKIGDPRIFTSVFSQQVKKGNSRLKKDVGGGALYDMGTYCINAARYLFGADPVEVFGWNMGSDATRFNEVREMTSGMMRFSGDRIATFTSSFGATDRSVFEVIGTKGVVKMDPAYEMVEDLKTEITVNNKTVKKTYKKRDQFAPELIYFSDCILKNKEPQPSGREGLADVRVIEALIKSATSNRPVEISPADMRRRPSIEREISRPPVAKPPALINAAAPGAGN